MADLCAVCQGTGCIVTHRNGTRQFWDCHYCGGSGVRVQYGPKFVNARARSAA